jgi:hypothetical protein
MSSPHPRALTVTERVLTGLTVLNLVYGAGILALLVTSVVVPGPLFAALTGERGNVAAAGRAIGAMRLMMVVGLVGVPVGHVILTRLRAMVMTVRGGDPFVIDNARRLDTIAYGVLAFEILHLIVGAIAKSEAFSAHGIHVDWSFSFTPWLAVLLLFVLARVFAQGARMRADLEGTV